MHIKTKPISSFDACRNNSRRPGSNVESQLSEVYTFHQDREPHKRPTDSNFQNYNFPIKLMYKTEFPLGENSLCKIIFSLSPLKEKSIKVLSCEDFNTMPKNKKK